MKQNKIFLQIVSGFLLCGLLSGCISSKYVGRKQYLFDLPKGSINKMDAKCMRTVFFDHVEAVAPFGRLNFLYRINSTRYLIDYYNAFLVSPAEQIDSILKVSYGGFNLDVIKSAGAKNRLQIRLTELYADYQDRNNPEGVIAVQFVLTRMADKENKVTVLLDKVFRASLPLKEKNTANLIKAWNQGLQHVLKRGLGSLKNRLDC